jgi:hypothetical protein
MDGQEDSPEGKACDTDLRKEAGSGSPPLSQCGAGGVCVADCSCARQESCRDENDQTEHRIVRPASPTSTCGCAFMACLVREWAVGNREVIVVLNMEKPSMTKFVGDPNRPAIFSPIINQALMAGDALLAKDDDVALLECVPRGCVTALSHFVYLSRSLRLKKGAWGRNAMVQVSGDTRKSEKLLPSGAPDLL